MKSMSDLGLFSRDRININYSDLFAEWFEANKSFMGDKEHQAWLNLAYFIVAGERRTQYAQRVSK